MTHADSCFLPSHIYLKRRAAMSIKSIKGKKTAAAHAAVLLYRLPEALILS